MLVQFVDGPANKAALRVGSTVKGKYHLDHLLGVGGMGAVYAATHRNGGRFAIKILHDRIDDESQRNAFLREARLANAVAHPGALNVLDDDVDEDGVPFLVLPLLEGETLRARWERQGHRLPPREVSALTFSLLDVLGAAHRNKIVHRDIKPENLFLTVEGQLRVLDFGIARLLEAAPSAATRAGRAPGTPAFMAPEQARGRTREIDGQTDIWAVGATMFTLLSGRYVHEAESADEQVILTATQAARTLATIAPDVPASLSAIVDKALAFTKADRWPDVASMQSALHAAHSQSFTEDIVDAQKELRGRPPAAIAPGVFSQPTAPSTEGLVGMPPTPPSLLDGSGGGTFRAAATRTSTTAAAQGSPPPGRVARVAFATLSVVAVGAIIGVLRMKRLGQDIPPSPARSVVSAKRSPNEEANSLYRAAIQSARDASFAGAREGLDRASRLDPTFASAHLWRVMLSDKVNSAMRTHYAAAVEFRESLDDEERALVDAYEPMVRVTPDPNESVRRLVEVQRRFPADDNIFTSLQRLRIRLGRFDEALSAGEEAMRQNPTLAANAYYVGRALLNQGRFDDAYHAFERCTRASPRATTCLDSMNDIDAIQGRCAAALEGSRHMLAVSPGEPRYYWNLARAIYGSGGDLESAEAALDEGIRNSDVSERASERAEFDFDRFVLRGSFVEARAAMATWEANPDSSEQEEAEHAWRSAASISLEMEMGDRERASEIAKISLQRRAAWLPDSDADYDIVGIIGLHRAGVISDADFLATRSQWASRQVRQSIPIRTWLMAYAQAAWTHDDAIEALAKLETFGPLRIPPQYQSQWQAAVGRTYLLAGRAAEAVPFLRTAATSCQALFIPLDHTLANYDLGRALEEVGDRDGACAAYSVVLARWGKTSASSAKDSRARAAKLHCRAPR
jgi:serine/threonine protein kinase/tetratricopeptide (TPR) repeat protein